MTMTATRTAPATRSNAYGARCADCRTWVAPGAGTLSGSRGAWVTRCAPACAAPAAPRVSVSTPVAPGYYVRPADGAAIVVVANKAGTRTYGKRFTPARDGGRPSWVYAPGLGLSVADLTPMTATDAAALGLSHGYCVRCCAPLGGATLSAAVSALIGYGETCAKREGWDYPHGVAAQRARLAQG
jgi:hypothetical protein